MAAQNPDSFERVLPLRDFLRGSSRRALIWALVAGTALFLALTCLLLLLSLFEHRGAMTVASADLKTLSEITGATIETSDSEVAVTDWGIVPTAWHARGRLPGLAAGLLTRSLVVFQDNAASAVTLTLCLLVLGVIWAVALAGNQKASAASARHSGDLMRKGIHRQALRLAPSNLRREGAQEALDLFLERTDRVQQGLTRWINVLTRDGVEILAVGVFLLLIQWRVGILCLIPIAICVYVLMEIAKRYERADSLARDKAQDELKLLAEGLKKSRLVRAYGMEDYEQRQFTQTLDRYYERVGDIARGDRMHRWLARITILIVALVILYFVLADRVLRPDDALPLADAVMIGASLIYLTFPFHRLLGLRVLRTDVAIDAGAVQRYVDRIPEVGQAVGAKFLEPLSRVLQFDAVRYSDSSGDLLKGLDLKINAGETVALVSLNPAEARAVAYMIPRFIEPLEGRVLIDGEDIAWVTLESLRAEAIFVGGDEPFFTGTVLQNLTCADPAYSQQQASEAARQVHAHNFIVELPAGYETQIGEHGEQLGPGQAFRLSLARAILRKPAVLVIEEPAESMEADDKVMIEDAYNRITRDRTVIVLPSRLSTIKRADRVVMIHNGRVEAIGPQETLVRNNSLYRHWEYLRFNEFRDGRA